VVANSVAWLLTAEAIQGIATGLGLRAAGAALLDLDPRRDPSAVGRACINVVRCCGMIARGAPTPAG
jgi:hypothetical protein